MIVFAVGILLLVPCIWSETSVTGQDEYWLSLRTPIETLERICRTHLGGAVRCRACSVLLPFLPGTFQEKWHARGIDHRGHYCGCR